MTATAPASAPRQASGGVPVVELTGVERTFDATPPVKALRGIDLTVQVGDYLSIVGPSGSGKSTLLHLLGLLDAPTAGIYRLDGIDTAGLSDAEQAAMRGARIGFVFQAFHLLAHRSAAENVAMAELHRPNSRHGRRDRAVEALEQVGLGHRVDAFPDTMSGGERQRVAIARALVSRPSLLLADEPTGNLDSDTSASILDLFDALHQSGLTVVVITHDHIVSDRAQRQIQIIDGVVSNGQ